MSGVMQTGQGDPIAAIHRRAQATVRRRRLYLAAALVILVAVLIAVPEKKGANASAPSGVPTSTALPPGVTPPNPPYSQGRTVGGVACGAGVLQVPWSAYAPPCEPAWHGNNGGATTRGVTGTTITLSYRKASTAQLAELYGLIPPAVVGTNQEEIQTLQSYINIFNKEFELYGRRVVLAPFSGKGDFIDEDLGMDQAQAQEDAVTVSTGIKAFADMSVVDASALYATDLAAQHVVVSSLYENPASWYQEYAPWEYTAGPNCTKMAEATGAILGRQLGGLPASFAGSASLRSKTRTFGIIYPLNPEAASCAAEDAQAMARNGQTVVKSLSVKFDLSSLISTADAAVADLKSAGVTTVILSSADPITPRFFMDAADADGYYPEWWFQSYFAGGQTNNDAFTRLWPADQIKDVISFGAQTQPLDEQEAITAYRLGNDTPGAQPIPSYYWTYESLLQFFDALQLAGPDLTPSSFEQATAKIPQSQPWGMLSGWNGAAGPYDPAASYHVVHYDLSAVSPLDGKLGTYVACDGNKEFSFDSEAGVPKHQQITPASCSPAVGEVAVPPSARYAAQVKSSG